MPAKKVTKATKKAVPRIFIVQPVYRYDTVYKVCKTRGRGNIHDLYWFDKYEELDETTSMRDALKLARDNYGCRNPERI